MDVNPTKPIDIRVHAWHKENVKTFWILEVKLPRNLDNFKPIEHYFAPK